MFYRYLWIEFYVRMFVIILVCLSYHILAPVICVDDM